MIIWRYWVTVSNDCVAITWVAEEANIYILMWVTVGVVLAVNGKAVEGRNMSNFCALDRSQKRCFTVSNFCALDRAQKRCFTMSNSCALDRAQKRCFTMSNFCALDRAQKRCFTMSNFCALDRAQKRCFTTFFSVVSAYSLLYWTVYLSSLLWNSSDPKDKLFIWCIYYE